MLKCSVSNEEPNNAELLCSLFLFEPVRTFEIKQCVPMPLAKFQTLLWLRVRVLISTTLLVNWNSGKKFMRAIFFLIAKSVPFSPPKGGENSVFV